MLYAGNNCCRKNSVALISMLTDARPESKYRSIETTCLLFCNHHDVICVPVNMLVSSFRCQKQFTLHWDKPAQWHHHQITNLPLQVAICGALQRRPHCFDWSTSVQCTASVSVLLALEHDAAADTCCCWSVHVTHCWACNIYIYIYISMTQRSMLSGVSCTWTYT